MFGEKILTQDKKLFKKSREEQLVKITGRRYFICSFFTSIWTPTGVVIASKSLISDAIPSKCDPMMTFRH